MNQEKRIPETKRGISLGSLCGVSAAVYRVLCRACSSGIQDMRTSSTAIIPDNNLLSDGGRNPAQRTTKFQAMGSCNRSKAE